MRWFALGVILVAASGCSDGVPGTKAHEARTEIRKVLNDPASGQFTQITTNPKTGAVCGLVNAKNRMAAYVGAQPFIFNKKEMILAIYTGQPDSYEIRRLADTDTNDQEWSTQFREISDKCNFPVGWVKQCGTPLPAEGNGHICEVWNQGHLGPATIIQELRR